MRSTHRIVLAIVVAVSLFAAPMGLADSPRSESAALHNQTRQIGKYRSMTWSCQDTLRAHRTRASASIWALPKSVPYRQWVKHLWRSRASLCSLELNRRTLQTSNDWATSIAIAQRPYPGTKPWLWSCSGAEGGHSEWVTYGGGHYYPGFEHLYIVGGPMQYKWPTFKGHYRHALDDLRARGYIVNLPAPDDVKAWLSMSAQALAAGWAKWSGNTASHWSASSGNGC